MQIREIIKQALKEDMGKGDVTTALVIPKTIKVEAVIIAKESGIVCGMDIARMVFKSQDKNIRFQPLIKDGDKINPGEVLAKVYGLAACILSSERVALNFLGLLSGIATRTREFVNEVKPYKVKIMDTRKTLPGLRLPEKYAVRVGGGYNHRFGLDEMVLIKDNHLKIINPKSQTPNPKQILQIKNKIPKKMKIEVEVKNLKEFKETLKAGPDIIMLDNMTVKDVKEAVKIRNLLPPNSYHPIPELEASGGINLKDLKKIAATGIDFVSLGTLTKDIRSMDLSLEIKGIRR